MMEELKEDRKENDRKVKKTNEQRNATMDCIKT